MMVSLTRVSRANCSQNLMCVEITGSRKEAFFRWRRKLVYHYATKRDDSRALHDT